jgi:hypothetical protein
VSDWIDTLFEYNSVTVLDSKFPVTPVAYNPGAREWRFSMTGINLRGLGEKGVQEEDTKGFVVIRAKKRVHPKCNAAANAARILFGCNPPVFTATALATFPCDSTCSPCNLEKEFVLPPRGIAGGDSLFTVAQFTAAFGNKALLGGWTFKWYPTDGLGNPFDAMPILTKPISRTYTLVASDSINCKYFIATVPVMPPHPLGINISKQCSSNTGWSITATATGRPPDHLVLE